MADEPANACISAVERIFHAALALEPAQRPAYLTIACANEPQLRRRVEALLLAHEAPQEFLPEQPSVGPSPGLADLAAAVADEGQTKPASILEQPGEKIGPYKLLQKIGEGGCGVVYMAEQCQPIKRRVALKIIKLGMDTKQVIARFEAERQALALMDHPNIAKVLDAGATETGRPYFVMELVRGLKITDFCDEKNLSTRERLELFMLVCRAVQHAHQKGVIHRDIKPSNILVTVNDGVAVPKVIDFGIAKATNQQLLTDKTLFTAFEQFLGTPAYMSPEQAEMTSLDIDTRTDIYSLGVLLYELLTGRTPFDAKELLQAGFEEMRRTIREREPQRPSTRLSEMVEGELTKAARQRQTEPLKLIQVLRGDLDWIVMKCLDKDRTRRYETANGLASDLQRHLNLQPVAARPPGKIYRLQKLVRRNKVLFAAAGAVTAALILGLGVSLWLLAREHGARRRADSEAGKSREVAWFLQDMLKGVGPSRALGRDTTMLQEILEETAKRVGASLTKEPEVQTELRATLADTYRDLGLYEKMEAMARLNLQSIQSRQAGDSLEAARALDQIGGALWRLGKLESAEATERQALAMFQRLPGKDVRQVARSLGTLGMVVTSQGRLREAEALERQAVAMWRRLAGDHNAEFAQALANLGSVLAYQSKLPDSEAVQREALAIRKQLYGDQHPAVAASINSLAYVLQHEDKLPEAEALFRETLAMARKLMGNEHPLVALALYNLACVVRDQGNLTEAEARFRETLAMRRKLLGNEHPDVAFTLDDLAEVFRFQGNLAEAEKLQREALAMRRKLLGDKHPNLADSLDDLGVVLREEGRLPEAETLLRDGLSMRRKLLGEAHPLVAISLEHVAQVLNDQAKAADAEVFARQCLAIFEKIAPNEWQTFNVRSLLGGCLFAQQKCAAAEPLLISACTGLERQEDRIPYYAKPRLKEAVERLVKLFENTGRPGQAVEWKNKLAELKQAEKHSASPPPESSK